MVSGMNLPNPLPAGSRRPVVVAAVVAIAVPLTVVGALSATGARGASRSERVVTAGTPAGQDSVTPTVSNQSVSANVPPPTTTVSPLSVTLSGGGLYNPAGVATNNDGTIYVADTYENVVASISGSTDSVIAGRFEGYGLNGDGGPAVDATLYSPNAVAVNAQGDIFIADTGDNAVREVRPNGAIQLFAGNGRAGYSGDGGPATRAELDAPAAVAVNSEGDVFIADTDNNVIREVTPDGSIFTVAGDGKAGYSGDDSPATRARLDQPSGVAVDAEGNLYIADSANNVIRRVSTSGVITTVAGTGSAGYSGDGGAATGAELHTPEGIAINQAGDLFIADTFNNAVRLVEPDDDIYTIASTGLNTPEGVAVDNSTGDVYVANTTYSEVLVITGLGVPGSSGPGPVAAS
jgi:DNA-binding beta-propeller fold protein YncE